VLVSHATTTGPQGPEHSMAIVIVTIALASSVILSLALAR
jgi:hypothetical protein